MIPSELFQGSDIYSLYPGMGKWTSQIDTIPIETQDFTNAYYLGWVRYENLPFQWRTCILEKDDESATFTEITTQQNASLFYTAALTMWGDSVNTFEYVDSQEKWYGSNYNTESYGVRLLNKFQPLSNSYISMRVYFNYIRHGMGTYLNRAYADLNINQFLAFRDGTSSLTIQFILNNDVYNITFTGTDFTDGYYDYNGGRVIISGYGLAGASMQYNGDIIPSRQFLGTSGQSYYEKDGLTKSNVTVGSKPSYTWQYSDTTFVEFANFATLGDYRTAWCNRGGEPSSAFTRTLGTPIVGGFSGTFTEDELSEMSYDEYFDLGNNNYIVTTEYADTVYHVLHGFTPDEIYKHISLYRWTTNNQIGYEAGNVWFPKIDLETNEFLCELITGTRAEVEPQLPDWFKDDDPTESDYDDDDKPEWEPPEPPQDEESGDRILPQIRYFTGTTNFITQYAMTNLQVSQFGHLLWTSWVDGLGDPTSMWQNFILAGQSYLNTGSINISDAINFIVSLKMFPFKIPNTTIDSPTNEVIIGTGMYPITVQNIYKIISPLIYLDFGTVSIPKTFGDFRDYDNMNICAVLPYCGVATLNPGDVIGRDVRCRYAIDLQSGTCTAVLTSWGNADDSGGVGEMYPIAQVNGQIGFNIPISSTNSGQVATRIFTDVSNVASSVLGSKTQLALSLLTGGIENSGSDMMSGYAPYNIMENMLKGSGRPSLSQPALSGGTGLASFIQPKTPYIQMKYGLYPTVNNYNHSVGVPSAQSNPLSAYAGKGYVECINVDVSPLTCHNDEKAAIKAALESGVYL